MSRRTTISIVTAVLLVVLIFSSRKEIMHAWELIGQINLWILALLIPGQIIVYYAGGEMVFSYLRDKKALSKVSKLTQTRMALELNFVNHILPSGGVSGISYMTWRLNKLGVASSRATMAQAVRYVTGFLSYLTLLLLAVIFITLDSGVSRVIILVSSVIACSLIFVIIFGIYIISSQSRLHSFARWLARATNRLIRWVTFGRKQHVVNIARLEQFLTEFHNDYIEIRQDKKLLVKPFLWGIVFTGMDIGLFMIGFWALGHVINPAPIVIAYGMASLAGFLLLTPGGAGAYEALMISFLTTAGTASGIAIAGILLTRVILLLGTIISGYLFYQLTLIKYGRR